VLFRSIIDNSFARRHFTEKSPIGRRIVSGKNTFTIIGVVGEIKTSRLTDEAVPHVYVPYFTKSQHSLHGGRMAIVARASKNPMKIAGLVRQAIESIDPDQPAFNVMTLADRIWSSFPLQRPRIRSLVTGAFASLALLLAFVGIYGVVSFSVSRRVREIGIRMAYGATRAGIVKMILRETMITCVFGLIAGTAGAVVAGRFLSGFLYGVKAYDPAIFCMAILFVTAVVFTAGFIPACRAASAEPSACLRQE
jgi:putative ABC transport system permease protein